MRKRSPATQIQKLKEENKRLKEQLLLCKSWIQREIAEKAYAINKRRAHENTRSTMDIESYESIAEMVESYFGQLIFVSWAREMTPHLIDAETNFFHFMKKKEFDGFVVTNGYQKALESLIENIITSGYRSYAKRLKSNLRVNNLLEKTLHKTVTKGYMLSVGKFFETIKKIRSTKLEWSYEKAFAKYLGQLGWLGEYILSDAFWDDWSIVLDTEVFGSRRHSGSVGKEEVQILRKQITGNYETKESILYRLLLAAQKVDN